MAGRNDKQALRAKAKAKELAKLDESQLKSYVPEAYQKKATAGRRSLYTPEILPRVEELAAKGLTNKEIAAALGVGERTFYDFVERYPQFSHSLKKYRGLADIEVENALYKSAIGFNFTEVKRERRKIGKDPETGRDIYELVITEEVTKHIPGVPTSQIFYLKNRMPERYRDKVEHAIGLADDVSQIAFAIKRRGE